MIGSTTQNSEFSDWVLVPFTDDKNAITQFVADSERQVADPEKDWVFVKQTALKTPAAYRSSTVQYIMLKWFLSAAVFGDEKILSEKDFQPLDLWISTSLNISRQYFSSTSTSYEIVNIPYSSTQSLVGYFFSPSSRYITQSLDMDRKTVLVLSGSFAPLEAYMIGVIEGYRERGYQVLAVNYIGFGDNAQLGKPNPETFFGSAEASLNFLFNQGISRSSITVHGYSLGGFAATKLAAIYDVDALVLDRVCESAEKIAYSTLEAFMPKNIWGSLAKMFAAKVTDYCTPFSLADISKVKGRIFIAQERGPITEIIGAVPYIRNLKLLGVRLSASSITMVWIEGGHITSPYNTWTVNGRKFSAKMNSVVPFGASHNRVARREWTRFVTESG
jgi:hypothetical protein